MELEKNTKRIKYEILRDVINVTTVSFYILYSFLKRFAENPKILWIPAILFFVNVLIIGEIIYASFKGKIGSVKKDRYWMAIQLIVNLGLAILCVSYLSDL